MQDKTPNIRGRRGGGWYARNLKWQTWSGEDGGTTSVDLIGGCYFLWACGWLLLFSGGLLLQLACQRGSVEQPPQTQGEWACQCC